MSDVAASVKQIFEQMPSRLNPSAAAGLTTVIQYDLTGEGAGTYQCAIKDGSCTITPGAHPSPNMTVTMNAADFVDLTAGKLDGMSAFMSGKLKIGGDMGLAMKLQGLFRT